MSTDYYTTVTREGCGHCERPGPWTAKLFIGMSAAGWRFVFKAYDEPDETAVLPRTLDGWRSFLASRTITDEYGRVVPGDDFWRLVEAKADSRPHWREDDRTRPDGPADLCPWLCP